MHHRLVDLHVGQRQAAQLHQRHEPRCRSRPDRSARRARRSCRSCATISRAARRSTALRQLEVQTARVKARALQRLAHEAREIAGPELPRGQVDGNAGPGRAGPRCQRRRRGTPAPAPVAPARRRARSPRRPAGTWPAAGSSRRPRRSARGPRSRDNGPGDVDDGLVVDDHAAIVERRLEHLARDPPLLHLQPERVVEHLGARAAGARARRIATSASSISTSPVPRPSIETATPMLAATPSPSSPWRGRRASSETSRALMSTAWMGLSSAGASTANSPPSTRPTVSTIRSAPTSCDATRRTKASPSAWPCVSLTRRTGRDRPPSPPCNRPCARRPRAPGRCDRPSPPGSGAPSAHRASRAPRRSGRAHRRASTPSSSLAAGQRRRRSPCAGSSRREASGLSKATLDTATAARGDRSTNPTRRIPDPAGR